MLATNAEYSASLDIKIAGAIWWLIGNIPAVHVGAASLVVCGAKHVRGDIVCARSMIRTALAHGLHNLANGQKYGMRKPSRHTTRGLGS